MDRLLTDLQQLLAESAISALPNCAKQLEDMIDTYQPRLPVYPAPEQPCARPSDGVLLRAFLNPYNLIVKHIVSQTLVLSRLQNVTAALRTSTAVVAEPSSLGDPAPSPEEYGLKIDQRAPMHTTIPTSF